MFYGQTSGASMRRARPDGPWWDRSGSAVLGPVAWPVKVRTTKWHLI